ncbi:uncharacterized protein LOC115747100 isoform X2 [Rhodamnia argentea]|uniref:Uncharacterized protein LOC115747100 isoform X2 n=1 Tax=Rhodamnia argentea TaxID=178133 RepID=A0A8B8PW63_9MYRT|nr:uncharacterized protein LOC115747100 isoform X2 [Rhodamnia argentea]
MAARYGSLSRSLIQTARSSTLRSSSSSLHRVRPSQIPTLQSRRPLFTISRNLGQLGCIQSLMPLHSTLASSRLTSHMSLEARAYCELSQGT